MFQFQGLFVFLLPLNLSVKVPDLKTHLKVGEYTVFTGTENLVGDFHKSQLEERSFDPLLFCYLPKSWRLLVECTTPNRAMILNRQIKEREANLKVYFILLDLHPAFH